MVYRSGQSLSDALGCTRAPDLARRHVRRRGVVLVWTAILLLLMILLVGLSLDSGKVALTYHQLHNAADAGALAGCRLVKVDPDEARRMAQMVAAMNLADTIPVLLDLNTSNSPDGDIIIGQYGYDRDLGLSVFVPYDPAFPTPVNALAVIASRDPAHGGSLPLNFGAIADVPTVDLTGWWEGKSGPYAIAVTVGGTGAGLICLREDYTGLELGGGGYLTVNSTTSNVNDGAIQINSFDEGGLYSNGTPVLDAL
ncbi:MAG: pilus assembly protein, partial [Phycisphaerales bacterium]